MLVLGKISACCIGIPIQLLFYFKTRGRGQHVQILRAIGFELNGSNWDPITKVWDPLLEPNSIYMYIYRICLSPCETIKNGM